MLDFITKPLEILLDKYSTMDNQMKRITRWLARALVAILFAFTIYILCLGYSGIKKPITIIRPVVNYRDTCIGKIDTFASNKGDVYNSEVKESKGNIHIGPNK